MALSPTVARERAEEWIQTVQKQAKSFLDGRTREAVTFLNDTRDDVERRIDEGVRRLLTSLQVVTQADVAELAAKMQTIAERIEHLESGTKKHARKKDEKDD
jgi:polyhydroxyalkanoate synthesis regulator phasin